MSSGAVLAWATEAMERGLVSEKGADGLSLAWGGHETHLRIVVL
jgi:aldehyde:ferredoxin oxidoreductase